MIPENLMLLKERLGAVWDIRSAGAVLGWDQETYMPSKGAATRGQQLATLSALAHRLFTEPEIGGLLERLWEASDSLSPADAKLIEVARYDYQRAIKLPESFVEEFALEQSRSYEAWVKARTESDFAQFEPSLVKMLDLLRRKADYFGYEDTPYDALLEEYERGATTAAVRAVFKELAPRQSALAARIASSPHQPELSWLEQDWPEDKQWDFTMQVVRELGYDLDAGRQDRSIHPFTTSFGSQDVRITTRLNSRLLFSGMMGSIHECGHALYEQGYDPADARTMLLDGASLGIHESQSRMWENIIGRSLPFWKHYAPILREYFPKQLDGIGPEAIYRAINHVQPSFIRVEADECTYNLHIIMRFELEVDLIEGRMQAREVPEAWNAKMKEYLGIDVPDDAHGCLQDIHWAHGYMGYFPTYALGNLYASQIVEAMGKAIPDMWEQVEEGRFAHILGWLREHIHRHGRRKLAAELIRDVAGEPLNAEPYIRYLERKYGALYGLA